jgi:hypothetical protein
MAERLMHAYEAAGRIDAARAIRRMLVVDRLAASVTWCGMLNELTREV